MNILFAPYLFGIVAAMAATSGHDELRNIDLSGVPDLFMPGGNPDLNPNDSSTWISLEIPLLETEDDIAAYNNGTLKKRGSAFKSCNIIQEWPDVGILGAVCQVDSKRKRGTALSLNHCLANNDGVLTWAREGNFLKSCDKNKGVVGYLDNPKFLKNCHRMNGKVMITQIILNEKLYNNKGKLSCFNITGY